MEKIEFVRCGEPHGISSSPHWSYRSIPAGVKSDAYYRASEVDAERASLLAAVRALVEAGNQAVTAMSAMNERSEALSLMEKFARLHFLLESSDKLKQAISAVEAIISPPHSSHPPADTGKA